MVVGSIIRMRSQSMRGRSRWGCFFVRLNPRFTRAPAMIVMFESATATWVLKPATPPHATSAQTQTSAGPCLATMIARQRRAMLSGVFVACHARHQARHGDTPVRCEGCTYQRTAYCTCQSCPMTAQLSAVHVRSKNVLHDPIRGDRRQRYPPEELRTSEKHVQGLGLS